MQYNGKNSRREKKITIELKILSFQNLKTEEFVSILNLGNNFKLFNVNAKIQHHIWIPQYLLKQDDIQ